MKRRDLMKKLDSTLLDKLFGFCYIRTSDSYEAQALCSDIVLALAEAGNADGEIADPYAFIWRVARNVYADFLTKKQKEEARFYEGDHEKAMEQIAVWDLQEDAGEERRMLDSVFRSIAFLSQAYREVMISYYFDRLPVSEIAKQQNTSETAVRQRLFSARQTVRNEVLKMDTIQKPLSLRKIGFGMIGWGDVSAGDPWTVCTRQLSKHIVWLCKEKPRTAKEISEELGVPMLYVEEELECLVNGANGTYGILRQTGGGRYAINIVFFSPEQVRAAWKIYQEKIPAICEKICRYVEENKDAYLAFPYRNRKTDMNLILWQQINEIDSGIGSCVDSLLRTKYFPGIKPSGRPFSVYGYVNFGMEGCEDGLGNYGCFLDEAGAQNLCGYRKVKLKNIYNSRIQRHFHCFDNFAQNTSVQLAIRAIDGISAEAMSEQEMEHAAKAIEEGYLYREGDMVYTKILVCEGKDEERLFEITGHMQSLFLEEADRIAAELAAFLRTNLPDYLYEDYWLANELAKMPVFNAITESLIGKGLLVPPENGIGAEGVWMIVEK